MNQLTAATVSTKMVILLLLGLWLLSFQLCAEIIQILNFIKS